METSNQTDGQNANTNGESGNQQQQVNQEQVKNPEGVLAKNRELLGINKKLSGEVGELRELVNSFQENQKISEGKKDEVIESLRNQLKNLKGELQETRDSYNWNTVESQVKQAAMKEGCVDADKLVKLISDDDLAALEVDSRYRVNQDDLINLVTKAKKENVFLFEEGNANINDLTPSTKIETRPEQKPVSQMSQDEIEAELKRIDALEKQQANGR